MSGYVHFARDLASFRARWGRVGARLHPYTHGSRAPSAPASRYTEEGDDVAAISWNVFWVDAGWVAGALLGRMYRQGTRR